MPSFIGLEDEVLGLAFEDLELLYITIKLPRVAPYKAIAFAFLSQSQLCGIEML